MLFTKDQLITSNALQLLEQVQSLSQEEVVISPKLVPCSEVTRLNAIQIPFSSLSEMAESNGLSLLEAATLVCETDNIDPDHVIVAMTEEELLLNPYVAKELGSIVLAPISSSDPVYQFCEEYINAYAESGDEGYLETILNEVEWGEGPLQGPIDAFKDRMWGIKHHMTTKNIGGRIKNIILRNPVKTGMNLGPAGAPLVLYGSVKNVQKLYDKFKNRPRNFIAKKIAYLRKLYETWLHRAKIETDDKTAGVVKRVATNIMLLIDKLLKLLQKGANAAL